MSEEKKNTTAPEADKASRPRRHGYFIQPPTASNTQDIQISNVQTEGSEKPQNQGQQHHRPHKHKVQNPPQGQNNKPSNEAQPINTSQPSTPTTQQKKKNNKNKNKNKNRPQTEKTNVTSDTTPAKEPQRTKNQPLVKETKPVINHSADDYEEYKLVAEEEKQINITTEKEDNIERTEVVGIRFKSSGKIYYFDPHGLNLKKGSNAIVDTARGQEYGEVAMANSLVRSSDIVSPLRVVIREATTIDTEHHKANKQKEAEAFKICTERIATHKLEMKLIDAQYTFDNTKLLFYFTSADRVDFRELVKDLASVFRTRIELRQIGIRDEAKLMGGLGMCGRPLCCTLFLSDFDQVSIKMAKEQNLSLNSAKISGICGRLMCCLKYEHEAYEYEIKRTPPVDSLVRTENGDGIVTEISPLRGTIKVKLLASPDVPPKVYHRDNVTMLRKKQSNEKK